MLLKMIKKLWYSSLYRNAIYLMATSIVMTGLGLFFWVICARYYTEAEVGLAVAMLSAMTLTANLSVFGFNYGLIRFLPNSKLKGELIGSCFIISGISAGLIAIIFLIGLSLWSPNLIFIQNNVLAIIGFIGIVVIWSITIMLDSIFLSYRVTKFSFARATIFSGLKIGLPVVLISLGVYGIFLSWGLAGFIALAIGLLIFLPIAIGNIKIRFTMRKDILSDMLHYSIGNYNAGIMRSLPNLLFPLMVVNILGAEKNAYFYVAWTIASVSFMIPGAISYSLFAEGSNKPSLLKRNTIRAYKFEFLLVVPAIILIYALATQLLLLFGMSYSQNAAELLRIFVFSSIPFGIWTIYSMKINVEKKIKTLIIINFVNAVSSLILSYIFIIKMGLIGLGYGWMLGQTIVVIVTAGDWVIKSQKYKTY